MRRSSQRPGASASESVAISGCRRERLPGQRGLLTIILASLAFTAQADSDTSRQLEQLHAEHEKALAAAVEPVNRRYLTALEQLARHAASVNDTAAAVRIKAEMEAISHGAEPLQTLFADSRWTWFDSISFSGPARWVEFYKDGTGLASWGSVIDWKLDGAKLTVQYHNDNPAIWHFEMNLAKKEGVDDPATSFAHEERSIRFDRHVRHRDGV